MRKTLICAILVLTLFTIQAQERKITQLEFRDKPLSDIVLALGEIGQLSVVPDASITGNGSYFFSDITPKDALKMLAASFNLYLQTKDGIIYASKIDARYDQASGTASLNAEEVKLSQVLRSFSKAIGKTVVKDDIAERTISIHAESMPPAAILGIIAKYCPDATLEESRDFFYLRKIDASKGPGQGKDPKAKALQRAGDAFSLDAHKASFLDLIAELFTTMKIDYSLLLKGDTVIDGLSFANRGFDEALGLILEQANADYSVIGGVYYVFDIQRKDILKKLKATLTIPIENYAASDLINLLPADFAGAGMLRVDKPSNTILINGSLEEIKPVQDLLRQLDTKMSDKAYVRFELKNQKVKDILPLLPGRFSAIAPIALPDGYSFILPVSEKGKTDLSEYLALIDRGQASRPIVLKYIKSEELFKNLPPSISKENLVDGGNNSVVFFLGSEEKRRAFLEELTYLDRPKPQIRYDILAVQYNLGKNMDYTQNFSVKDSTSTDTNSFSLASSLSTLLNLKFDIVSELGYLFSLSLSSNLQDNDAQIYMDTSVFGLVGKDIKFQNTTTDRYKDVLTDSSGSTTSSVTREVTTGLILTLNGWASGDGMITVDISATISETGTSSSTSTTTAPQTSERVMTTSVHTPSGTPIAIGGLRQRKAAITKSKPTFLASIPLIGKVFENRVDKSSETEIMLYLVPHLLADGVTGGGQGFHLERVYLENVKGY